MRAADPEYYASIANFSLTVGEYLDIKGSNLYEPYDCDGHNNEQQHRASHHPLKSRAFLPQWCIFIEGRIYSAADIDFARNQWLDSNPE
jgi:hypothetical protein